LQKANKSSLILDIPKEPGIYKMLDKKNGIIYIGKAKNLKNRVSSYFTNEALLDSKTQSLVKQIHRIDTIVTNSEKEALILENQLIKQYQPKYNIILKDDKSYPYVKITRKEDFPKVLVVREKLNNKDLYLGPLPALGSTKNLQRALSNLFQLRTCKKAITDDAISRKCIQFDLGNCLGPCINKTVKKEYEQKIINLILLLNGKDKEIILKLKEQMRKYAQQNQFEKAAKIRDSILQIEQISERQIVCLNDNLNRIIVTSQKNDQFLYILFQTIIKGKLLQQQGFYVEINNHNNEYFINQALESFFVKSKIDSMNEIICTKLFLKSLKDMPLSKYFQTKLKLTIPQRGFKFQLLENANKNAYIKLQKITKYLLLKQQVNHQDILLNLKNILKLPNIPETIIGFDISHLYGENIVGSSVYFQNAIAKKSEYKRYLIKTIKQSDDPRCIQEIVFRCLHRIASSKNTLPNLLLIDGGKVQLNFANKALIDLGLQNKLVIISIAKKYEEIFTLNNSEPIRLSYNNPTLKLLQSIRDEAHRFALKYQKIKRKDKLKSKLSSINGVGPKRVNSLYAYFKNIDNIANSNLDELAKVGRIGKDLAKKILSSL
jgi:excinuclease ABC subunit C